MYDDILVPTDGAEGFEEVAKHAVSIGEKYDATIHAINVVDSRVFLDSINMAHLMEELEQFGHEKTQEVGDMAREKGLPAMEEVREGIPHKEILKYADEKDVDLIVMGTHGRTGLGRMVMGSVAEKVIRKSDVPVLSAEIGSEKE